MRTRDKVTGGPQNLLRDWDLRGRSHRACNPQVTCMSPRSHCPSPHTAGPLCREDSMPLKAKPSRSGVELKTHLMLFFFWIGHFLWNFMRIFFLFGKKCGHTKKCEALLMWDPGGTDSVYLILGVICGSVWEGLHKAGNSQVDICISVKGSSITQGPYWITGAAGLGPRPYVLDQ